MSEPTATTVRIRDDLVATAQSLPQLVDLARVADPQLAAQLTPKLLLASRSPPGVLAVTALTWAAARYGLGWDPVTVDLAAGFAVLVGGYAFRAITRSPIGGLFRLKPAA